MTLWQKTLCIVGVPCAIALCAPMPLAAGQWSSGESSGDCTHHSADFCETREFDLKNHREPLDIDGSANGGIRIRAWDGESIRIRAEVIVHTKGDRERAEEIARKINISTDGQIKASGPRNASWSVSYDVAVPRTTDLRLRATNGGISVEGVSGDMDMETTNGGLRLSALAGDVRGHTTNGGLDIQLSGQRWMGKGLDVRSTNGGVKLGVPDDYSADLSVGTVNGGLHLGFPVTVMGSLKKQIHTKLGDGGAPIKVSTTNGGIHLYRD